MSSNDLLSAQSAMNRSTRGQWEMYGSHRQQIERLIVPDARGLRACVLGAGNCNDLDLRWLSQVYGEVHLVDLDADALAQGVKRQQCEGVSKLHLHAPIDLSGAAEIISQWKKASPNDAQIDDCLRRFNAPDLPLANTACSFDLVLSPCVLSQLLIGVRDAIGSAHPRYPQLRDALRRRHLSMIADLLRPGGRGVLIIDLASTEDFPALAKVTEENVADLMRWLTEQKKCFAALAQPAMLAALQPMMRQGKIGKPSVSSPWLWHLGLRKSFLVYAVSFTKQGSLAPDQ